MSEDDPRGLREALHRGADAVAPRPLDAEHVISASRSSRRARRTALLGTTAAVAGILATVGVVAALAGLPSAPGGFDAASTESVAGEPGAPEAGQSEATDAAGGAEGIRLAPPEKVNGCGTPVAAPTDATGADGGPALEVSVGSGTTVAPGAAASVAVTVTNRGDEAVRGLLRVDPVMVVADAGITAWHTSGPADAPVREVELAPGESVALEGVVEAVRCAASDEGLERLPGDLPPLERGVYGVGAIVVFSAETATAPAYVVSPLASLSVG